MELKKIGILSAGKIGALFGLLQGIIAMIVLLILKNYSGTISEELAATIPALQSVTNITTSAAVISMIWYIIMGFLVAIIAATLYNLFAKWVGGIEVELVDKKAKKK